MTKRLAHESWAWLAYPLPMGPTNFTGHWRSIYDMAAGALDRTIDHIGCIGTVANTSGTCTCWYRKPKSCKLASYVWFPGSYFSPQPQDLWSVNLSRLVGNRPPKAIFREPAFVRMASGGKYKALVHEYLGVSGQVQLPRTTLRKFAMLWRPNEFRPPDGFWWQSEVRELKYTIVVSLWRCWCYVWLPYILVGGRLSDLTTPQRHKERYHFRYLVSDSRSILRVTRGRFW